MPDTKPQLFSALIKAQEAMGPVKKEARGNYGKYATLDTVLDTIDKPLHDNDLVYTQLVQVAATGPNLITRLIHAPTGESIESVYPIVSKDPNDPQKIGASITYARRYSLMALLGLAPEDDDGTSAATPSATSQRPASAPAPARQTNTQTGEITEDQPCSVAGCPEFCAAQFVGWSMKEYNRILCRRHSYMAKTGTLQEAESPKQTAASRSTVDELADIDEAAEIFGDLPPYQDSNR